jgi:hypothetical protein
MKFLLLTFALFLSAAAPAQQMRFSVSQGGRALGEATMTQRVLASGGKAVELRVELSAPGRKVTVRQQSEYDAHGAPMRMSQEVLDGERRLSGTTATFDEEGAHIVVDEGGSRKTRQAKLVASAPRRDASEFWFLRDHPEPGTTLKVFRLDLERQEWVLAEVAYTGRKLVKLATTQLRARQVTMRVGDRTVTTSYDDRGLPMLIEGADGFRMERTSVSQ